MPVVAHPLPKFHGARYILADEEKIVGPVESLDLAGAVQAAKAAQRQGPSGYVPDLRLWGEGPVSRWLAEWPPREKRSFVVQDVRNGTWIQIKGAWPQQRGLDAARPRLVVDSYEAIPEPAWWFEAMAYATR